MAGGGPLLVAGHVRASRGGAFGRSATLAEGAGGGHELNGRHGRHQLAVEGSGGLGGRAGSRRVGGGGGGVAQSIEGAGEAAGGRKSRIVDAGGGGDDAGEGVDQVKVPRASARGLGHGSHDLVAWQVRGAATRAATGYRPAGVTPGPGSVRRFGGEPGDATLGSTTTSSAWPPTTSMRAKGDS